MNIKPLVDDLLFIYHITNIFLINIIDIMYFFIKFYYYYNFTTTIYNK